MEEEKNSNSLETTVDATNTDVPAFVEDFEAILPKTEISEASETAETTTESSEKTEPVAENKAFPSQPSEQMLSFPDNEDTSTMAFKTKWNWGAFSMPLVFGIAHRSYLGLLVLLGMVPFIGWIFGFVWMIVFGINAEKWTLNNLDNHYRDEEEFRKIMDTWNLAGIVVFIIGVVIAVLSIFLFIFIIVSAVNSYNNI
ncbi:hypothetical protein ACFO26_09655 [Lactococcus nasutitermitis]|uniref:TM2 domain-containing protein n=1 Tax=Lactococcus nasutitermitis TaxID=1652957 RepID=A0ABV9JFM5_9LACT|nr:hypothetical protein [Lactococcus nasutitermitis]